MAQETSSFNPDNRIALLSGAGFAGFIFGCFILFLGEFGCGKQSSAEFHEVLYSPRTLNQKMVDSAITVYKHNIAIVQQQLDTMDSKNGDTAKTKLAIRLKIEKDRDSGIITQLIKYKDLFEHSPEFDSTVFCQVNNALHFRIKLEDLAVWDSAFAKDGFLWKSPPIEYYMKKENIISQKAAVSFSAVPASSNIAFITRHPIAGIWIMLVMIFCSFCFVAVGSAIHLKERADALILPEGVSGKSWWHYLLTSTVIFLLLFLLWFIGRYTYYDESIVKNFYFMRNEKASEILMTLVGFISGAFCLTGFLYTASMLRLLAKPAIEAKKEVQDLVPGDQALLQTKVKEQTEKELAWQKLFGIFKSYFTLASIILSLMVLCTGTLYSLVNSLDFVALLSDDWGFSPVRTDFIYLYGGMFTVVLLLVYIPARIRFAETDLPDLKTPPVGKGKWLGDLKSSFSLINGILVAGSPFIVSIIQSLIDMLFQ